MKIKELVLQNTLNIATLLIVAMILWLAKTIYPLIIPSILEELPNKILLILLAVSMTINFALFILFLFNKKEKLKPFLGAYWDKNLNPYCPACKSLVRTFPEGRLSCLKCKEITQLSSVSKSLTLSEAHDLIKNIT